MKRTRLVAALAFAALLPFAAHAQDATVVASPTAVKWRPAPPALPKGTMVAVLYGDPTKSGPFVSRTKFPAGAKVMPHTHPADENITVLSGVLHIGFGDKFNPKKGIAIRAGGFTHNPAGTAHYAWFTTTTVIQNNAAGPFGLTYVNAAK